MLELKFLDIFLSINIINKLLSHCNMQIANALVWMLKISIAYNYDFYDDVNLSYCMKPVLHIWHAYISCYDSILCNLELRILNNLFKNKNYNAFYKFLLWWKLIHNAFNCIWLTYNKIFVSTIVDAKIMFELQHV